MLIGEMFGTPPNHTVVKSISSVGKSMFIDFKKQYTKHSTYSQFNASITYNKINPECQSWLQSNVLMSPSHLNMNCSWLITKKVGSYITLDFNIIEVKPMNITTKMYWFTLQFLKTAWGGIWFLKNLLWWQQICRFDWKYDRNL